MMVRRRVSEAGEIFWRAAVHVTSLPRVFQPPTIARLLPPQTPISETYLVVVFLFVCLFSGRLLPSFFSRSLPITLVEHYLWTPFASSFDIVKNGRASGPLTRLACSRSTSASSVSWPRRLSVQASQTQLLCSSSSFIFQFKFSRYGWRLPARRHPLSRTRTPANKLSTALAGERRQPATAS